MPMGESGTFREIDDRIKRLEKDMWHGNGKPGMTTRMAVAEECMDTINANIARLNRNIEKSNESKAAADEAASKKTDRLTWLVAVGVGIVVTLEFILKK